MRGDFVWIDGCILEGASVPAVCPGVSVGMGVFETMAVYSGRVFAFEMHFQRLVRGCERVGFVVPEQSLLESAMREVIEGNSIVDGRMRVTLVDGGDEVRVIVSGSREGVRAGDARLVVARARRNEFGALVGIKATSYAENLIILREATAEGADEAVILNTSGDVCEGATSNLFFVEGGKVFTPALSTGCLAGVTREIVLSLCAGMGVEVEECCFSVERLLKSEGVFLTGSLREVQRVGSVGDVSWEVGSESAGLIERISLAFRKRVGDD